MDVVPGYRVSIRVNTDLVLRSVTCPLSRRPLGDTSRVPSPTPVYVRIRNNNLFAYDPAVPNCRLAVDRMKPLECKSISGLLNAVFKAVRTLPLPCQVDFRRPGGRGLVR